MIITKNIKNTIIVLGLGKAGIADALYLRKQKINIICWDDNKTTREKACNLGLPIRNITRFNWDRIIAVVISPGIAHTYPQAHPIAREAKIRNIPLWGDVELLYQNKRPSKYIGITGTNGKSTVSALVHHIMQDNAVDCQLGGNFGTPAVELQSSKNYVLEMSSYMLDICPSINFDIAVWLNISKDHLERHNGLQGYINSKMNIFQNQQREQHAIICIDDIYSYRVYKEIKTNGIQKVTTVSTLNSEGDYYIQNNILYKKCFTQKIIELNEIKYLKGEHNTQNMLAAIACCESFGLQLEQIKLSLLKFKGLAHRQEHILSRNGITYINDSKATNSISCSHALKSYDNIFWIAGGQAKENGINDILDIIKNKVLQISLYGQDKMMFYKSLISSGIGKEDIVICETLEEALRFSQKQAENFYNNNNNQATVLLSPACASWDMFDSFEHRGEIFKKLVLELT